ncbi:MAG: putative transport system permease protein [Frankiales bacterium]|nr:putative transport system permease protein [Frankiales bacterium]
MRSLLARKLRLVLSAMAVVLGVSFVAGSLTLTDTLGRVFDNLFTTVNAKTDVVVRGQVAIAGETGLAAQRQPVSAALLPTVRGVPGVLAVAADTSGYAQVVLRSGKAYSTGGAPSMGRTYDGNPLTSPYTLRSGAAPSGPDQVALDAGTAKAAHLRAGEQISVILVGGVRRFTLSGTFGFGTSDSLGGASIVGFDSAVAGQFLGRPGEYEQLRVAAVPGVPTSQLRDRVAAALPPGTEAVTGKQSAAESADAIKSALGFFNTLLLVFAGVALFVGGFLIFNTFTMLVAQRQRELALLRALGASRRQVTSSVLTEALVVGVCASALGLGLGMLVALGLKALVSALGGTLPAGPLVVTGRTIAASFLVGIIVTAVAALLPARRASAVPPIAAMREAAQPESNLRRSTATGVCLLIPGVAMVVVGLQGRLATLGLGCLIAFLGIAALSPVLSRPIALTIGAPMARKIPGRLGRLNAMRNPRRTASTAAALMIGLALVSAVSVLGASAKASVSVLVQNAVGSDLVAEQTSGAEGLPPEVAQRIARLPEVGRVDHLRGDRANVDGRVTAVTAVPATAVGRSVLLEQVSGDVTSLAPGRVLVAQDQAKMHHLTAGARVTVILPRGGARQLTVAGIYKTNQLAGPYLLDSSAAQFFETTLDGAVLISGRQGVAAATLRTAVDRATADMPTVVVFDRKEVAANATRQIDTVIAFINVLLLLSIGIAVLGIVNTLALSIIERTRELGLLRAIGLGRMQTRRMISVEAVIVSLFGALLGIAVGTALGIALQNALNGQGITELAVPYPRLAIFVLAAGVAGMLAAVMPARRAARLDVLRAIAT